MKGKAKVGYLYIDGKPIGKIVRFDMNIDNNFRVYKYEIESNKQIVTVSFEMQPLNRWDKIKESIKARWKKLWCKD